MERHVDSTKRNSNKSTFKDNRLGLGLGLLDAFKDDCHQMRLDILQGHALHKSGDVNVLSLQVVEKVCKTVDCTELEIKKSQKIDDDLLGA